MRTFITALAASAALLAAAAALPAFAQPSSAQPSAREASPSLQVDLEAAPANPASPRMGDRLSYRTSIRNVGAAPVEGIVAWLGLVQVDRGKEQPVDLEDWSAHKAVTIASLAPGQAAQTDWPMRLIAAGHYRVVVSAASSGGGPLTPSPFVDLAVRAKPVVESRRVLPVALGVPALLLAGLLLRRRQGQGQNRGQRQGAPA